MSKVFSEPVDIVVTFVDNCDPDWQAQFSKYVSGAHDRRYRQWDNFRFWLRAVAENAKFVRNVFMVVSNIEQVPDFVDQSKVKIVLHKDIIPEQYLPTFNSTTIEMFLCKIPGLSEHFIYFNDDMFPNSALSVSDFFDSETGFPIYQLINRTHAQNTFRMQCRNSYRLAKGVSGFVPENPNRNAYFYIKHSADPMLKSVCLELWDKAGDKISRSLTRFREPFNFTQYLFPDFAIMTNRWKYGEFDFAYYTAAFLQIAMDDIQSSNHKMICVNDNKGADFEVDKARMLSAFKQRYTSSSRFEK